MKSLLLTLLFLLSTILVTAQMPSDQEFTKYAQASFPQFKELLGLPNDAHFPKDIEVNVKWSEKHFQKRGFKTTRLNTPTTPLLLAEKRCNNKNAKTVLIYLQVDGQPVDPNHWFQENPYEATLKELSTENGWDKIDWENIEEKEINRDWRIFARSTSDAKGPANMFLTAVDMMLEKNKTSIFI